MSDIKEANHSSTISRWSVASAIVFVGGMLVGFLSLPDPNAEGVTSEILISWLTTYAVISVLLGGFGQLLRAVAQGASSDAGKNVDGIGKVTSLFGWSLGLPAAVTFAVAKGAPELLLNIVVLFVFSVALVVGLVLLIRFLNVKQSPQ